MEKIILKLTKDEIRSVSKKTFVMCVIALVISCVVIAFGLLSYFLLNGRLYNLIFAGFGAFLVAIDIILLVTLEAPLAKWNNVLRSEVEVTEDGLIATDYDDESNKEIAMHKFYFSDFKFYKVVNEKMLMARTGRLNLVLANDERLINLFKEKGIERKN